MIPDCGEVNKQFIGKQTTHIRRKSRFFLKTRRDNIWLRIRYIEKESLGQIHDNGLSSQRRFRKDI